MGFDGRCNGQLMTWQSPWIWTYHRRDHWRTSDAQIIDRTRKCRMFRLGRDWWKIPNGISGRWRHHSCRRRSNSWRGRMYDVIGEQGDFIFNTSFTAFISSAVGVWRPPNSRTWSSSAATPPSRHSHSHFTMIGGARIVDVITRKFVSIRRQTWTWRWCAGRWCRRCVGRHVILASGRHRFCCCCWPLRQKASAFCWKGTRRNELLRLVYISLKTTLKEENKRWSLLLIASHFSFHSFFFDFFFCYCRLGIERAVFPVH